MNPARSRLTTAALVATAAIGVAMVVVLLIPVILGAIANAMWAFVMTPGGIVATVLLWKWLSLQEARARKRKRS